MVNYMALNGNRKITIVDGDLIQFALDDVQYRVQLNKELVFDKSELNESSTSKKGLIQSIELLSKELNDKIELIRDIESDPTSRPVNATDKSPVETRVDSDIYIKYVEIKWLSLKRTAHLTTTLFTRVLEKRVHELRNTNWDKEQEIEQLKRLLKTKNDRYDSIEVVQKTNEQLESDITERNLELHRLKSEVSTLESSFRNVQSMYSRAQSQNSELRDSNGKLRQQLLSAQNYSNYLHNELMKNKFSLPPPIRTEILEEGSITPRVTSMHQTLPVFPLPSKIEVDPIVFKEKDKRIQELENQIDALSKKLEQLTMLDHNGANKDTNSSSSLEEMDEMNSFDHRSEQSSVIP